MTTRIIAMFEGKEEHFYSPAPLMDLLGGMVYTPNSVIPFEQRPPRLIRVKNHNNRDVVISSSAILKISEDE